MVKFVTKGRAYISLLLAFAFFALLPQQAMASGGNMVEDPIMFRLALFVLAIFVGYFVVWSVTPALHTPLMAVTNAISSVIIVGALLAVGVDALSGGSDSINHAISGTKEITGGAKFFGFMALVMASVNIFGGFLVTQRMLAMYKKKDK